MKSIVLKTLGAIAVNKRAFRIVTLLVLFVTLFLPSTGYAAKGTNILDDIKLSDSRENMEIAFTFDNAFTHKLTPRFYEKSIQLDVPGLVYKKRTIPILNEFINEIRVYPFKPGVFRVRMMLAEPGKDLKKDFSVVADGNRLLIRFKRMVPIPDVVLEESVNVETTSDGIPMSSAERTPDRDISVIDNKVDIAPVITKVFPDDSPSATDKYEIGSDILSGEHSLFTALTKMGGALAIVLALIAMSAFVAKKVFNKKDVLFGKDRLIRVLATGQVGLKKEIAIVEVAGEVLVLGITNNNITMLTKLEGDEAINAVRNSSEKGRGNESVVASFKGFLGRKGTGEPKSFSEALQDSTGDTKGGTRVAMIADVAKIIKSKV